MKTDEPGRRFLTRLFAETRPRVLIVSGDVTDTGATSAWDKVAELFETAPPTRLVVPGNHDYHLRKQDGTVNALDVVIGLFTLRAPGDEDVATSYGGEHVARQIARIATPGKRSNRPFPILHDEPALRTSFLLLDSNRFPSSWPLTNAIGWVGRDQLRAADRLLKTRKRDHALVIVLHHQMFADDSVLLTCLDAADVLMFALRHRASAIVHGHKHYPYVRELTHGGHTLTIVSVGSALFPAKGPCGDAVKYPSCMGLILKEGDIAEIVLYRDAPAD